MKTLKHISIAAAILFVMTIAAPTASAQTTIPAEDDTWITGNSTKVDFSNFGNIDLASLLGSAPVSTIVNFNGVPLNSSLGKADTLLARGAVTVSGNKYSASLSLKGLHLSSSPDMQLQNGHVVHVDVTLATQGGSGHLDFTQTSSDGGTYSSSFDVTPIFTFTDTSNPGSPVVVDCSNSNYSCSFPMAGGGNYLFTSQSGFDPSTQGIPTVPSGVQVGSYTTVGRPQYGGIQVGCGGTRSAGYHCNNQDQQDELHGILGQGAGHNVAPANDCAQAQPAPSPSPTPTKETKFGTTSATRNAATLDRQIDQSAVLCSTTAQPQ